MPKKLSNEEFVQRVNKVNPNIELLEEYTNMQTPIKCKCNSCKRIYYPKPQVILSGATCTKCRGQKISKSASFTLDMVRDKIKDILPNVELIQYTTKIKDKKYIQCRCKIDDHIWEASQHHLIEGHGCPKCQARNKMLTEEEFLRRVEAVSENIIVLDKYKGNNKPIHFQCTIDGYIWKTKPSVIISDGCGCPKCGGTLRLTHEQFLSIMTEKYPTIEVLGTYINGRTPIKLKCKYDGCVWYSAPTNYIHHVGGCPVCNRTHGERRVAEYLDSHNILYFSEYRFPDCKYILTLPFDFYLPLYNMCIEYDGQQHFCEVRFDQKMTDEQVQHNFKIVQIRDQIKTDYCKEHNIRLLRIPYTEYKNINQILEDALSECQINKAGA